MLNSRLRVDTSIYRRVLKIPIAIKGYIIGIKSGNDAIYPGAGRAGGSKPGNDTSLFTAATIAIGLNSKNKIY